MEVLTSEAELFVQYRCFGDEVSLRAEYTAGWLPRYTTTNTAALMVIVHGYYLAVIPYSYCWYVAPSPIGEFEGVSAPPQAAIHMPLYFRFAVFH